MPHYMLAARTRADDGHASLTEKEMQTSWQRISVLEAEMKSAGAWVFSARLHDPDTATVVRVSNGEVLIRPTARSPNRRITSEGSTSSRKVTSMGRSAGQRRSPRWLAIRSRFGHSPESPGSRLAEGDPTGRATSIVDGADIGRIFRAEAGRSVATLIRVFGDIDMAEDAVQDAFATALKRWPVHGLPPNPGAWITTTARNRAIDRLRRSARERELLGEVAEPSSPTAAATSEGVGPRAPNARSQPQARSDRRAEAVADAPRVDRLTDMR